MCLKKNFLIENVWIYKNIFNIGIYFKYISIKVYMKVCQRATFFNVYLKISFDNNCFLCNYLPLVYTAMGDTI